MKKGLISLIFSIFVISMGVSQVVSDPNHHFYKDVEIWETEGLISCIPELKPFSMEIVRDILSQVEQKGSFADKKKVQEWKHEFFDRNVFWSLGAEDDAKISSSGDGATNRIGGVGLFSGNVKPVDKLALSYSLGIIATNTFLKNVTPSYAGSKRDVSGDAAGTGSVKGYVDMNSAFSYGTKNMWVQGGISRNSYGPFYDSSVVLDPQSYHTGNITVGFNYSFWSFSQSFFSLGASKDNGKELKAGKYLSLHQITVRPFKWLDFSYFETVMWGNRFEFTYLLPAPYMIGQSIGGFDDNLQMGMTVKVHPIKGLSWNSQLIVDDVSMNELLKLDLDTKIIAAGKTSLSWSPSTHISSMPFFKLVKADYTIVNAYMYTHQRQNGGKNEVGTDDFNFANFTHNKAALGSQLQPNSHKVSLKCSFEPISRFTIDVFGSLIQHGNVNESLSASDAALYCNAINDTLLTDGSVFNHAYVKKADGTIKLIDGYQTQSFFLKQAHLETTVQAGCNLLYKIVLPKIKNHSTGDISLRAGYIFEYIHNYGVSKNMYTGGNAADSKAAWIANLSDKMNHYISFSVIYRY